MTASVFRPRVLIADDHRMMREALRALLEGDCEVVGEASDGEQAVSAAARLRPDVVLLDLAMPGMGGLAAAHRITARSPSTKVLVLSQYDDEEYVVEALGEAHVAGYLLKSDAAAQLRAALASVREGKRYVSPSVAPVLLNRLNRPGGKSGNKLTRREREVLKLIAEGAAAKEIAARLGISPKTAQVHRENLKRKLNARSTAALVRYAVKHKLVRQD